MASRLTGARTIITVDEAPERLTLTEELGATHTLEHGPGVVAELKAMTGDRLDFSIEATDGSNLVSDAVEALGVCGTCAMVGGANDDGRGDVQRPRRAYWRASESSAWWGGGGQSPLFLDSLMRLQRDGRFPLEKHVASYDFAEINHAIDDSDSGTSIKPVVRMR